MRPLQNGLTRNDLLKQLWEQFWRGLSASLDKAVNGNEDYGSTDRIDKVAVFHAMRQCRGVLETDFSCSGQVYCRYSKPQDIEEAEMDKCEAKQWGMIEYLLDFSFSCLPIPVAIGQKPRADISNEFKYEMLLAAESEMGSENEVARDFLKLLDVRANTKLLVYRAREKVRWIHSMEERLRTVMRNHAYSIERDRVMIAGVPSYFQWA